MGATTAFGFRKAKNIVCRVFLDLAHGCPSRPNPGEECERLAFVEGVHWGRELSGRLLILGKACEQNDVLTLDAEPTPPVRAGRRCAQARALDPDQCARARLRRF